MIRYRYDLHVEDGTSGLDVTAPASREPGILDDRTAVRMALAHGFNSPSSCEHHGGDGLSVGATDRDDLRTPPPRLPRTTP